VVFVRIKARVGSEFFPARNNHRTPTAETVFDRL